MKILPPLCAGLSLALLLVSVLPAPAAVDPEGSETIEHSPIKTPIEPTAFSLFNQRLSFDIYQRIRWEIRENNYDFDASKRALTDDNWFLFRFRIGAGLQATSWLKFYAQGQDAREYLSDRADIPGVNSAEGDDSFDLRQAYVQIGDPYTSPFVARIGRQTLEFGDERLVGRTSWGNFGRTFDAIRLYWLQPTWQLEAFTSSVAVIRKGQFNQSDLFNGNEIDRQQIFSGVYLTHDAPFGVADMFAYWLSQANSNDANSQGNLPTVQPKGDGENAQHTSFGTYGFRLRGEPKKLHGWEFDAQAAYQNGELRDLALNAFAVHLGLGYTFDLPWKVRLWAEGNYATGDHDPNDNDSETFQNLFPSNHKFYGFMDLFSWQNLENPMVSLRVQPKKNFFAQLDFNAFWLASSDDAWYKNNGITQIRPLNDQARRANNFVGTELDLVFLWNVNKRLDLQWGYSHFFPGRYVGQTGPSDDADFGYVMAIFNL